uniref:Uncharacterized protein n=1 Tax=Opuntia streptacantha TaxID=393608 RepID=A0A7C9ELS7_OPUST
MMVGQLQRPTITLPPRGGVDSLFSGSGFGASPGPMTLVSIFFSENDPDSDRRSFSQLLAGAMASPAPSSENNSGEPDHLRFRQSRPAGLVISQQQGVFTVPAGLSPATLLDCPGLFPGQVGQSVEKRKSDLRVFNLLLF